MGAVRPDEAGHRGGVSCANPALVWQWYAYRFGMVGRSTAEPRPPRYRRIGAAAAAGDGRHAEHRRAAPGRRLDRRGGATRQHPPLQMPEGRHTGFTRADFAGQAEIPPRCPRCGELLRPDVVWFGELLPGVAINRAYDLAGTCDAMLVVGTSGVVQPAASLPFIARRAGATVIDVNPDHDEIAGVADFFLEGRGGEILPRWVAELRSHHKR